ncbi:hypothetical protein [Arachidicoccus soli]|uniref:Uncharacterized protein n=1 Tax=Arachidicoccus soli TaxID=2341117 RepID=A0A386HQW7_9BACT|nr:hypothetical protein [Arachidicoccus soli]AYD47831.1 hypothetical protein D6B99_09665 [Arachidicoccus soli]
MRRIFFCLLIFCCSCCFAEKPSLPELRILYEQAPTQENSCKELLHILKPYDTESAPLMAGYRACAQMIMSKYVFNPFSKWSYFSKGKSALSAAISVNSNIVELRFLRFTVQNSAPFFLGYHDNLDEDKIFLLNSIQNLKDMYLKDWIIRFLKHSKFVTINEKKQLL